MAGDDGEAEVRERTYQDYADTLDRYCRRTASALDEQSLHEYSWLIVQPRANLFCMDAPPTRDRLIHAAMRLFHEKGYQSTSVADLLREAEANPGSMYHFFPTKQDLLVAVLERYRAGIHPMLLLPAWDGVDDPIERIFALLGRYRELLKSSDCFYGCPIGSLALELHEPDPPVRALLAANFDAWTGAIEGCIADAGPRLPPDVDPHQLATFVLTTMEGGVMLSRTHRDLEPFDAAVNALRDYFARLSRSAPDDD